MQKTVEQLTAEYETIEFLTRADEVDYVKSVNETHQKEMEKLKETHQQ